MYLLKWSYYGEFQPYSEYLQIEKELKELDNLEVELEKEKTSVKVVNEPKNRQNYHIKIKESMIVYQMSLKSLKIK